MSTGDDNVGGSCFAAIVFAVIFWLVVYGIASWVIVNERAISSCKANGGVASRVIDGRYTWWPPGLVSHGRVTCVDGSVKQIRANPHKGKK